MRILDGSGTLELWVAPKPGWVPVTEPQETHRVRRGHVVSRPRRFDGEPA